MTYTSHGHHIPFTRETEPKPDRVARCGGVGLCPVCAKEAAQAQHNVEYKTAREDLAKIIAQETSGLQEALPEQDDYDLADAFIKIINGNARHELPRAAFDHIMKALS